MFQHTYFIASILHPFLTLAIFYLSFVTLTQSKANVVLRRCPNFEDYRNISNNSHTPAPNIFKLPAGLTNVDQAVDFEINDKPKLLTCRTQFVKDVNWDDGEPLTRVRSKVRGWRLGNSSKSSTHFTHDGDFYDDGHTYLPSQYCIKSISETGLQLEVCEIMCTGNTICIPKCCGVDEVLVYWKFTCRKINAHETRWKSNVHLPDYPHKLLDDTETKNIHIVRQTLKCASFHQWPLSDAIRALNLSLPTDPKSRWKLLRNGRPILLTHERDWVEIPQGDYCIDGYANWGFGGDGNFSGNSEAHSVMLRCPSEDERKEEFSAGRAWTYAVVLVVSSFFLLLTAVVHFLLLDKQHLHGLVVLSHSISMFFLYILSAAAHFTSIFPSLGGSAKRGGLCLSIAILSHYFFMTTFTWLTVMNFDLWYFIRRSRLTFRSMRPTSQTTKRLRRFQLYSGIGWGLPLLLTLVFITVNEVFSDYTTEVVVPDYANDSCFVATWARGHYMYSLILIALVINTIFVIWTFHIFYEFHQQNRSTLSSKRMTSNKHSAWLFIKLFCVMGMAWFIELISWYYNGESKPWVLVVLDCVEFFQALGIFLIFCMNRRTLKQLEEKYPSWKKIIGPIRMSKWFRTQSDTNTDNVEMTAPGSTSRKISMGASTSNKMFTLERKSCSAESSASPKSYLNQCDKMRSINLDSTSGSEA